MSLRLLQARGGLHSTTQRTHCAFYFWYVFSASAFLINGFVVSEFNYFQFLGNTMGFTCKVPFAAILVIVVLLITMVPSILIWIVFSGVMNASFEMLQTTTTSSLDLQQSSTSNSIAQLQLATTTSLEMLENTTTQSIEALSSQLQGKFLGEALSMLNVRIMEGNREMAAQETYFKAIGGESMDHRPWSTRVSDLERDFKIKQRNFVTMKAHPYFSYLMQSGIHLPSGEEWGVRTWWITWQAMDFDLVTAAYERTIYLSELQMEADESATQFNIAYPNHKNGAPLVSMQSSKVRFIAQKSITCIFCGPAC